MEGKDFSSPDIRDIDRATPREETARNIQERRWRASISGLAAHFLDVRWCISLFCNEFLSLSLSLSPDACICTLYVCTLLTSAFLTFSFSYKAPIRGHLRGACTDLLLLFPLSPHSSSSSPFFSLSLSFVRCRCLSNLGFLSRFFQLYIYIYILYLDISWRETDDESSSKGVS